uniref:Purine permease 1 n=1 Tax=Aegilops tauschii subsp. strangulata TaxID=200361 RepID=A0A453CL98_AEGTS
MFFAENPRPRPRPHPLAPRLPRRPLPVAASYLSRRAHDPSAPVVLTPPRILLAAAGLGLATGADDFLYVYGLSFVPVSTSAILISTQLAFTVFFAFLIVRQRLTALSVNAVALLTVGAVVLGLHVSSDRPAGVSKGQYWLGFLLTLAAAALYGLVPPLIELTYKRAAGRGRVVTYALVMEMQLVMGFFATAFCTVGTIVNNDFQVRCPCHSPLSPHSTRRVAPAFSAAT